MFIQDGNALFHSLINLLSTFRKIGLQILDLMTSKKSFSFSSDPQHPDSIKTQERFHLECGQQFILECQEQGKLRISKNYSNV